MKKIFLLACLFCAALATVGLAGIFDPWGNRMRIRVTAQVPGPLTNFPLLVCLDTNIAGFAYSQFIHPDTGADLRFANSNETVELPYEIEYWNPGGVSAVWVTVPLVEGTNTTIYAYWRKGVPAGANPGAVWDDGFATVWHLSDTNGVQRDSTTNARHAWLYPNGQTDFTAPGMSCDDNLANGAPGNVIDNNTGTEAWEATSAERWWRVDLGAGTNRVAAMFRYWQGWQSKDFKIQGSANDVDWVDIYSNQIFFASYLWMTYGFQNTNAYRYYRLTLLTKYPVSSGHDPYEVELYEAPAPFAMTPGIVAGCQDFDGVSNELNAIRPLAFPRTNISFTCWSKHDVTAAADNGLLGTSGELSWQSGFGIFYAAPTIVQLWVKAYNIASNNVTATVVSTNWNHLYGTYDGSILALYVNGELRNIKTNSTAVIDSSWWFSLGRMADPSTTYKYGFNGKLDEVRLETVGRSSNWVWACWLNQASNNAFMTYGPVMPGRQLGVVFEVR